MAEVRTARQRARAETTEQIKDIARSHLAVDGPNLSLRAVARDLGVVSSAIYRYFASRDDLLTALILDAYAALGSAVEQAEARVPRRDLHGRWIAMGRATRDWARRYPHEYALIYGSPVPGYAAPRETVVEAQRPLVVAVAILGDGVERGAVTAPADRLPKAVRASAESVRTYPGFERVPATLLTRALAMWAQLYGAISFELFGRYRNSGIDEEAEFEHQLKVMSQYLGLSR
ncbi:TetR/AcrR family transcriptional regulator [uncultured Jatrophihabitans sp.]|uniref:TetR/AcrR family transcriptional regulator n=1 Tax=uncultured Jatrophihabitans sp. TaxID=1610747 RepID=UPI0035C9486E